MFSLLQKEVYLPLLDKSNFGKMGCGLYFLNGRSLPSALKRPVESRIHLVPSLVLVRVSKTGYLKKEERICFCLQILSLTKQLNSGLVNLPCCVLTLACANDVYSLLPFGALGDLKLDRVTFVEGFVPIPLNGAKMHKHIFAVLGSDKPVTLLIAKPLHCTFYHFLLFPFLSYSERLEIRS